MASWQEESMRHAKRQKQFEETEQTSELDTDTNGDVALPAWEFLNIYDYMIRA